MTERSLHKHRLTRRACVVGASMALAVGLVAGPVQAQEKFPSKPIQVVTHAGAGGGTDVSVRMMLLQARSALKQDLVVLSKTGGNGAVSINFLESQPADGYTILAITPSHLATIAQGKVKVKFEDLVGIARMTDDPQYLMIKKGKYASAKAMIEAAQKGKLKVAGTQVGGVDHIAIASFAKKVKGGFQFDYVPYKGGAHIATALIGGDVDVGVVNYSEAEAQVQAGEIEPILSLTMKRKDITPNTAAAGELGIPVKMSTVRGVVALKGTPQDRVDVLEKALMGSMKDSVFQTYLKSVGLGPDSVVGAKEWQAQMKDLYEETQAQLKELGFIK
ncbi:Bug family tripartite tricarboxylate transporter substrate binding protein [Shumkonia mesophila]|uniref:Bug family tripartite tricarboxylate transporter substrate binding protein n=1 Tax=Shumkonia mesophila TaxID=2838854 RepID=UPI0029342506|nr:tripartite tricarboxylate transporter substrate binding protein [Shumkonia mesophila]